MFEVEDEVLIRKNKSIGRVVDKAFYEYLDQYVYAVAEYETSYIATYFEKDLETI